MTLKADSVPRIKILLSNILLTYPVNVCRKEIIEPIMAKLEASGNSLAAAALLQREIVDYSVIMLNSKIPAKPLKKLMLICAQRRPIWKLAISAIELTDANFSVTFINQPCNMMVWCGLVEKYLNTDCIVFQEDVWRERKPANTPSIR